MTQGNGQGGEGKGGSGVQDDEVIDLEDYAKQGKDVPKEAKRFKIRIDKEKFEVTKPELTGREILGVAGKVPEQALLMAIIKGGASKTIELDELVDLSKSGIEKFKTMAKDHTEGLSLRRQFDLMEDDRAYLDGLGLSWEALVENSVQWIVVHDLPVMSAYMTERVAIAIRIEPGYPTAQLDMAYFYPALALRSGQPIKNTESVQALDGKSWQRWSRHRTGENPWRPGLDNLSTHLEQAKYWIAREVKE